jgi:hypothetical protein
VRKNAERVKVRGICSSGHVTETFAPRRRTTWSGPCSAEGCELAVTCRRVPKVAGTVEESEPVTLPSGVKVRRVAGYERPKRPSRRAGVGEAGRGKPSAETPASDAGGEPAGPEPVDDDPAGAGFQPGQRAADDDPAGNDGSIFAELGI